MIEPDASAAQVVHAVRRWRSAESPADVESAVSSVLDKVEEIDTRDVSEARWLLHRIGTERIFLSNDRFLNGLVVGLRQRSKPRHAATVLTLVFTRTTDGWRRLAGAKEDFLRAITLDEDEAWTTLIGEIADSVKPGASFGSTVNLLRVLAAGGRVDEAFACWEEARNVIAQRLPLLGPADTPAVPYDTKATDGLMSTAACLVALLQDEAGREPMLEGVRLLVGLSDDEAIQVAAHMITFADRHLSPFLVDNLLAEIEVSEVPPFDVTRKAASALMAITARDTYSLSKTAQRLLDRTMDR